MAIREISRRGHYAGHADEIRRRSDGYRTHVQGGLAKGDSFARTAYAVARASGCAGLAIAREIVDASSGPHPLAAHRGGARAARRRNRRTDKNRSVVYPAA